MSVRRVLAVAVAGGLLSVAPAYLSILRGQSGPRLYTTWSQPGGSIEGAQYSALKQINKTNVNQLEWQWFYPAPGPVGRFAFSPLVVDNVMYVVGKDSAVFALDAVTGKEIWRFDTEGTPTNRGFNYWESKTAPTAASFSHHVVICNSSTRGLASRSPALAPTVS